MQSLTKLPQSIERVSAAYERIQGSLNPVIAAQQRAEREMTQSLAVINRAVLLNVTTEEQAAKDIAALRNKQIADIARVREAQLRGAAANQNNRFAALNATNQFQDIAVTAAMGQSVGTIALQQGTQLGMALQQSLGDKGAAGAAKVLGSAITGLFTPINMLAIGLTALVAVGIKLVNWGHTAASVVMSFAHLLPKIADYAAIAAAGLALLYAPALLSGLTLLSEAILGVTARLVGLAIGFAAANPGVAFVLGITAIIVALNVFRDDITQTFGVDVIGIVKKAANYIVGSFVAVYHDIKFLWANFPDIIEAAAIGAVNAIIRGVNSMIGVAKEGINTLIGYANRVPGVKIDPIDSSSGTIPEFRNPAADRAAKANSLEASQVQADLSRDYMGEFGTGIAKGAALATDKLKELAKWLTTVKDKSKKSHGKTEEEKFEDIVTRAQGRISALKAEQAGLGMTDLAAEKLKDETELLNEAQRKGITLTASQKAQLIGLADQLATTEVATRKLKEAYNYVQSGVKGVLSSFSSAIEQGKSLWQAFGDAAKSVIDKIVDRINDQLATAITNALFQNGGSQTGLFGSILGFLGFGGGGGGGGGLSDFAQVAISGSTGLFASGGPVSGPGSGTSDSILARVSNGEFVINAAATAANLPLLKAINSNRFANGGLAGIAPLLPANGNTMPVANQNSPVIQIIDQRSGGTIEREERDGVVRLIVRDEIKKSGVGTVANHVRNHQEAKKRSMIK
jgi:hypothetical protein